MIRRDREIHSVNEKDVRRKTKIIAEELETFQ